MDVGELNHRPVKYLLSEYLESIAVSLLERPGFFRPECWNLAGTSGGLWVYLTSWWVGSRGDSKNSLFAQVVSSREPDKHL